MVSKDDVFKKEITILDLDFDISSLYKGFKQKVESLGYALIEKDHATKSGKYGDEIRFKLALDREIDDFGKCEGEVEMSFENLKRGKGKEHGDAKIKLKLTQVLDFKNRWGMKKINQLFFKIYKKVKKSELDGKYEDPLLADGGEMYNFLKDSLGLERA